MQKFPFSISKIQMRELILNFASQHSNFAALDSCAHVTFENIPNKHYLIAGLGIRKSISANQNALQQLQPFLEDKSNSNQWKFGFLSYDLKNEIENLNSKNQDAIQFPLLHFYIPEIEKQMLAQKKGAVSTVFKSGFLGNYFANLRIASCSAATSASII